FTLLPYLKLRLTHGYTGNVNNSISALTSLSFVPVSGVTQLPYAVIDAPPNSSLRWEQVRNWNAGIDFELKGRRLTGTIEFYDKRSTDVLTAEPVDLTTGFNRLTMNSASLRNRGVDLSLTS